MAKNDAFEPKEVFSGLIEDEGISRRSLIKGASAVTAAAVLPTLISPSLARAQAPADPGYAKFYLQHQVLHLRVKELEYWNVSIRDDQVTLGSCVFYLKRPVPSLADLSAAELVDLGKAAKWFEAAATKIFGAEKFMYYSAPVNPYCHIHALPRYSHDHTFAGKTYSDKGWPGAATLVNLPATPAELDAFVKVYSAEK